MIDWDTFKRQVQANPQKMLSYVLGIAGCFLVIWLVVIMQSGGSTQSVTVEQSARLDSLRLSMSRASTDTLAQKAEQANQSVAKEENYSTPFADAWPTFLVLLIAIGGLWLWIKRDGAGQSASGQAPIATPIGSQEVVAGQQLSVVKINSEYWVLTSGSQGLNLLHRYSQDEWDGPEVPKANELANGTNLFSNILKKKQVKEMAGSNEAL